jgi:hypothetical protein
MGACVSTATIRPVSSVLSTDTIKPMNARIAPVGRGGLFYPMDMNASTHTRSPEEIKRINDVKEAFDL